MTYANPLRIALASALLATLAVAQQDPEPRRYPLGPDSSPIAGAPSGRVTHHELRDSRVFPGTLRRYSVYVPAQYDGSAPAALMVFQDGHAYLDPDGALRATVVFDNLIHRAEMPVTIGVFVDPGHLAAELPATRGWRPHAANRSVEYDALGPDYARFLLEDLLPRIEGEYSISQDPALRAVCGLSSGGIAAFTAAWERPDAFGKVVSHIGSFTNIRGGDAYPGIIRKADAKPLRVYLQGGSRDLDNEHGSWWLANQRMAAALAFKGYDFRFDRGEGGHDANHGGALLPDAMRWLWRDATGVTIKHAITPGIQTAPWALDWWMPRHEAKIAERRAMGPVDLLMVGDSITHGWEDAGRSVWDEFFAHRRALNIGFGGDRTEHVVWRIQNGAVDDIQPKVAVVMIGTNNTGHRMEDAAHTARGIRRVITELRLRMPSTKVLLLGIFPRGATAEDPMRQLNDAINQEIRTCADEKTVWFLDLADVFLDDAGNLPKSVMPDLLHPNETGYRLWAEAMEPTLRSLLR